MIAVVAASTLVAYIIYCSSPETAEVRHRLAGADDAVPDLRHLPVPLPRPSKEAVGSPSEVLLTDRPLVLCVALWGLTVVAIIYRPFGL